MKDDLNVLACPKCGDKTNITKFDKDVYIVRNNNDFVRRKLYGCRTCENLFTYDDTPRKEPKNMDIRNILGNISKQCERMANTVTSKT